VLRPMGKSKSFGRGDGLNQKEKVEHEREGKAARRTEEQDESCGAQRRVRHLGRQLSDRE
jgi:hypothetical protein